MKIYERKDNSQLQKQFIIPKNDSYNCKNWVHIKIDEPSKKFMAEKITSLDINEEEWEVKENRTFPSSILSEFLRSDYQ